MRSDVKGVDAVDLKDIVDLLDDRDVFDHRHDEHLVVRPRHPLVIVDIDSVVRRATHGVVGASSLRMKVSQRDELLRMAPVPQIWHFDAADTGVEIGEEPVGDRHPDDRRQPRGLGCANQIDDA